MPNKVTIKLSLDSATADALSVSRGGAGGADSAPSPLSLDALGAPADAGQGGSRASGEAPKPLPLDKLQSSSREDQEAPAPSLSGAPASAGDDEAPPPMPLDELPGERPEG